MLLVKNSKFFRLEVMDA